MDAPPQSRPRPRKRQRVSEAGNTANPAPNSVTGHNQGWGPTTTHATHGVSIAPVTHSHPQAVRAHTDTVHGQPPTFPSQHLERSHHQQLVAGPDGLMNGYNASAQHSHSQYSDQTSALNEPQASDLSGLSNVNTLGDGSATNNTLHQQHSLSQHQHPTHHQQLAQQQHQHQQHNSKTDRGVFQQYGANNAGSDASPTAVSSSSATFTNTVWPVTSSAPPAPAPASSAPAPMPPPSPAPGLAPPPEGIYRSFDDLLASVQKVAKDQGYGVVKLRASNYRDGKPTRYDLVCDRGGVKYNSTAKKRNPSTRKIDCPFRAKAVCEVNLGNQWRFQVQEGRHNHEPRIPAAVPGQENTPVAQGLRSATHKIDRLSHDTTSGFSRLEAQLETISNAIFARLNNMEKRMDAIENGRSAGMLGGNGVPSMATPSMPTANMGGGLGNGPMTNGGMGANAMVDHQHRLSNMERVAGLDRGGMGGLDQRGLGGMEQRGMDLQMDLPDQLMPPIGPP
ncbi:hypothetical protein QBC37DRAFT_278807 [Rhypophila decipiens]|uniref:Uncharacterized protein n=1 Tax=Rhypophila decipiens TaxID=261697 RepID=A0AAN6YID1_9PEZI|nr:hypothetical protein QBC37DRAFT_278807 [Rhypophila decipiens]